MLLLYWKKNTILKSSHRIYRPKSQNPSWRKTGLDYEPSTEGRPESCPLSHGQHLDLITFLPLSESDGGDTIMANLPLTRRCQSVSNGRALQSEGWTHCSQAELRPRWVFREGVTGEVERELGLGTGREISDIEEEEEEAFGHKEKAVFSFPVDSLPLLKLDLPAKTGPEDPRQKSARTSKGWMGFEWRPTRQGILERWFKNLKTLLFLNEKSISER